LRQEILSAPTRSPMRCFRIWVTLQSSYSNGMRD
jgi:hypothetical protein